jgi:hypothetical protein
MSSKKPRNYYPLNVRTSLPEYERLKKYCDSQKRSITEVVRELIRSLPDD